MIMNVAAYTRNSIYEKGVFAMLNKAKIEIGLKNSKEDTNHEEDSVSEGADNG